MSIWLPATKGGLGHVPSEVTGFGIRYTMSLLLDEQILKD